ncbi:MAG: Ig-like domain-containing protein [Kiritimatiellia bacterium]
MKIAFQDVAMPTDLRLTADELKHGGITGFELDVLPQTADKVADVSADLHLTLNGVEQVIPFAFPNSECVTNDLSLVEGEAKPVTLSISGEALADALGGPFLSGDEVSYYAAVHYDAANGATDPAERYETRFFPDNSTTSEIDGTTYWVVEGDYGVAADLSANTFTVSGAPLSCIGEPVVTTDGVSFDLHGYAAAGITNLTVSLNGKDYAPFEGLETNAQVRVTGSFALPESDKLDANTEYVVTIAATDANGEAIEPSVFTIVTLPTVTGATITGLSADTVRLTVSGNAAGFVAPAEWTQTGARAWERSGIAPNTRVEATVFATNQVGAASVGSVTAAGYTLAAVATKAPVIEKGVTTVTVGADHTASADGNPEATEYAVRVTTSAGGEATSAWKTLTQWRDAPETFAAPMIDLTATNFFSFVTRNADGAVTANPTPVTTNCWFEMTAQFEPESVVQVAEPYGTVRLGLAFSDPAQGADATATVEYKLGAEGAWTPLCADFDVVFDEQLSMTTNLAWDAWTAVGGIAGTYAYTLRTRVVSGARASEWAEVADTLDFAAPTGLVLSGTPASGAVTAEAAVSLAATATDAAAVTYHWTFNGVESTGAMLTGTAQEGANEVRVYAVDALGNRGEPVVYTWTLDTTAPTGLTISGTPAPGAVTAEAAVSLAATATDATAVTYHWTFNGVESTGATLTGTAQEGANEASVCAVDAAGNTSATVTRTWTLDTTAPTDLTISGTPAPGALTAAPAVELTAAATDATAVTYHWTFNGVESTGETLTGTAREGANEASVCAVDAAGNTSAAVTRTWTLDTTAPTGLTISGTPAPGAVTAEAAFSLAATATDATAVTYHWTFNGVESTGATLTGTAREGANTASVCAVDAAGNTSAAVTRTWTLDTTAPTRPVIGGEPAADGTTNAKEFRFFAESTDATAVTYHWTFDGVESTGATLAGTAQEGANTVSVYAVDAAGNTSETATRSWTVDTVAPTVVLASASPAYLKEGETLTVTATFSEAVTGFTAAAVTVVNGTAQVSGSGAVYAIVVSPTADGAVSVRIAADAVTDLAGNGNAASAMLTRTYDTTAPEVTLTRVTAERFNTAPMTVLVELSERVTNDFTLAALVVENGTIAAIEAVADTPNAYQVAVTPVEEGEVSVQVAANTLFDVVGHGNAASAKLACIYDVTKPTVELASETPDPFKAGSVFTLVATFSEAVTNFTAEAVTVVNGTAKVAGSGAAYTIAVTPEEDGEVSVRIAADAVADAAGNGNEPSEAVVRVYDATRPSVTLASETRDPFNGTDVFTVVAAFSEAVTNFTAAAVTAGNGTVGEVVPLTGEDYTNAYSFVVTPEHDGEVTVAIAADAVTDLAGNGNAASETLVRTCDVTPPTVTFTSSTTEYFNADNTTLTVTATFSEPIAEEVSADAFDVRNGKIDVFSGSGKVYALTLVPDGEGEIAVRLKAGVVTDAADNANVESGEFVRVNDTTSPTDLAVSGVPQGETSERSCRLVASATDKSPVRYQWMVLFNGVRVAMTTTAEGVAFEREFDGAGTVRIVVQPIDAANNYGEQKSFTWTIAEGGESEFSDVAFGDDVSLPVDSETGATNRVTFTSVAFRPGAESTFTLQGFAAKQTEIANLNMWLVVRETLAGPSWRVALEATATYDAAAGTLTVTLPATALQRADGTPFGSLFITGIDNQNQE